MSNPVCSPEIINCVCGMMMMSGATGIFLRYFREKQVGIHGFLSQGSQEGLRYWKIMKKNGSEETTM